MTESSTNHLPPACPKWCTLPEGHPYDDGDDRLHKGPLFGGVLRGWGMEGTGRPMQLEVDTEPMAPGAMFSSPDELRALAKAAEEAARWLESAR